MTQWGVVLLGVYMALGLSSMVWRKAGRLAIVVTTIVIAAAMAKYGALR